MDFFLFFFIYKTIQQDKQKTKMTNGHNQRLCISLWLIPATVSSVLTLLMIFNSIPEMKQKLELIHGIVRDNREFHYAEQCEQRNVVDTLRNIMELMEQNITRLLKHEEEEKEEEIKPWDISSYISIKWDPESGTYTFVDENGNRIFERDDSKNHKSQKEHRKGGIDFAEYQDDSQKTVTEMRLDRDTQGTPIIVNTRHNIQEETKTKSDNNNNDTQNIQFLPLIGCAVISSCFSFILFVAIDRYKEERERRMAEMSSFLKKEKKEEKEEEISLECDTCKKM